ncbi:O-antigen ligase [Marinobacter pelagius]|uniref:O-antigen ligase n=1 Tax=Marinobacter pelagius TaxID=379482 RepID=A0A366GNL1_9GAMM|nr:O-antigen ligase [Marinobacter pelagius]
MDISGNFSMQRVSAITRIRPVNLQQVLFAVWLLLGVVTTEDVYRTFFHVLIYPLTIYLLIRVDEGLVWRDPFIRLFLLFCGYMSLTTWMVGSGPYEEDLQAFRWGLEAALGMLAYFFWAFYASRSEQLWGRCFLVLVLTGTIAGLVSSLPGVLQGGRLGGLGVMTHPIQGASVAIIFLATGLFLTFRERGKESLADILLAVFSILSVCIFVIMTKSRAPIASLAIYLSIFAVILGIQYRRPTLIVVYGLVIGGILLLTDWAIGLDVLYKQLLSRGASYRFDIWTTYLTYPPETLLLGNGAGVDFRLTDAYRLYFQPMGLDIAHPHNIWLGAFSETGLIGVLMQAGLVCLPVISVLRSRLNLSVKFHLLALVGLFLFLTFSDEYTLLRSVHPIWFFGWIPLIFVWVQARYCDRRATDNAWRNGYRGKSS